MIRHFHFYGNKCVFQIWILSPEYYLDDKINKIKNMDPTDKHRLRITGLYVFWEMSNLFRRKHVYLLCLSLDSYVVEYLNFYEPPWHWIHISPLFHQSTLVPYSNKGSLIFSVRPPSDSTNRWRKNTRHWEKLKSVSPSITQLTVSMNFLTLKA
jgi:hypothetical protein